MDTSKKLRHLSYCSGYDGIGIGLELAGFDIGFTVHVEIEAFATFNLLKKMEAGALGEGVIWPNLKTFPVAKFRGCFDILSGGFPCQPFSAAGKRGGDEDERHLFPYILNGIKTMRPALVVLENVDGIVSATLKGDHWRDPAGTPVLLHVIRELERVGYKATAVPSSASEVGAPHQRNRWFIIGLADSKGEGLEGYDGLFSGCSEPGRKSQGSTGQTCGSNRSGNPWPSRPGEKQFGWEPPRVVGNASGNDECGESKSSMCGKRIKAGGSNGTRELGKPSDERFSERWSGALGESGGAESESERSRCDERSQTERKIKPPLGGNPDGASGGMDYAELCESCDNRTDELRLLGNGVVPQSCADAVLRGLRELLADSSGIRHNGGGI